MMKMVILLGFLSLAPTVLGQKYDSRGEVFGSLGGGKAYDDEGGIGSGFDIGGGIGYRVTPRVSVEAQVSRIAYRRDFSSGVRFAGTAVFTTGDVLYHFSTSRVQPYVLFGVGHSYDKRRSQFPGGNLPLNSTANGFAMRLGAGVKIFLNKKYSLRPEFSLFGGNNHGIGSGDFEQAIAIVRASVAFSYHW